MSAVASRPKLVLLGMMTKIPVGGVIWQVAQYVVGFQRLGFDVYYVEAHARTPSMLMEREGDDASALAADFIAQQMGRLDMRDRWAFHALHDDGRCYGLSKRELRRLYREAALIINLHGGTTPLPEHAETGRLVFLGTDPVEVEVEVFHGLQETLDYLEPHVAFFTAGLNYGNPDCGLPWSPRFPAVPSAPPVVMDRWQPVDQGGEAFTTIGNWRQQWRAVEFRGETYTWSKHHEFLKVLDLPRRVEQDLELALSSYEHDDQVLLQKHGWQVVPGLSMSRDPDSYRDYIRTSRGEFSVAKDQNVRLRSGWFSERSATYLAAGRPVVLQDTGFGNALPTGQGLFAFDDIDTAAAAIEEINADYARHRQAAYEIARAHFDSDVVLGALVDHIGIERLRRTPYLSASDTSRSTPLPDALLLTPSSRRPLELPVATVAAVRSRPVPSVMRPVGPPYVSVVVVTWNNLVVTRLALESLLLNTPGLAYEVVVVDNASTDGTAEYLQVLASRNPHVVVVANDTNRGFAAASNQGIGVVRGHVVVLLNNDTVVPLGALQRLAVHAVDPAVGLVGAVTNRCGNEAEVPCDYGTYGELLAFARKRTRSTGLRDLQVAVMFCVAARREVLHRVGPLDERFEIGMFEDDDYAHRVRHAGLRVACAEDVFVHHFGEASFGVLAAEQRYGELFHANRARFEQKWGMRWEGHGRRADPAYDALVVELRSLVEGTVPPGSHVLVVSKGDDALVDLRERTGRHFPSSADGAYAGHHPADAEAVVMALGQAVAAGATHLAVPEPYTWWLDHYAGLRQHLSVDATQVAHSRAGTVFRLHGHQGGPADRPSA